MFKVILLTLFASASAFGLLNSTCPEIKTDQNFDFNDFATGKWYEYAVYQFYNQHSKCNYWIHTLLGENAKVVDYAYIDGNLRSKKGFVRPVHGSIGKLIYTLPNGLSNALSDTEMNVLAYDNKNYTYVLAYECKYFEEKKSHLDFAWIFTRSKTLTKETETEIDNAITSSGYLDKSKFIKTDLTDEICKDV